MKNPYEGLKRDCQNLHGFNDDDIKKFVELGDLKKGMVILDAMCGDGLISKEIINNYDVDLSLLDNSRFQIDIARKRLSRGSFVKASVLDMPFEEGKFDRVFIRSGIYEIEKNKQIEFYKEIYRVLKKDGRFLCWTIRLNQKNQRFFIELARAKDKVAGFNDLLSNRYFATEKEIIEMIRKAGFKGIKTFDLGIYYQLSTKKWCEVDFKGDKKKLKELNEFIRKLDLEHEGIEVINSGDDIKINVLSLICVIYK